MQSLYSLDEDVRAAYKPKKKHFGFWSCQGMAGRGAPRSCKGEALLSSSESSGGTQTTPHPVPKPLHLGLGLPYPGMRCLFYRLLPRADPRPGARRDATLNGTLDCRVAGAEL